MSGLFSAPTPKAPSPVPQADDPAIEAARRQSQVLARGRKGRAASVLTGNLGGSNLSPLPQRRLLGG